MTDRKYAVQYMDGDEMCTRDCSSLGTAVMVRNHLMMTEYATVVEVVERNDGSAYFSPHRPSMEIIARSGSFSVTVDHDFITSMTRDELRIMAKDLDIAGRGGMDKGQLQAAVLQAYGYKS